MAELESRYRGILNRIETAAATVRRRDEVVLIAVSKGQSADAIEMLYRMGHRDFGENYVQELVEKAEDLVKRGCTGIRWHFIGHLQSNKVKALLPFVHAVHSVDSEKLGKELAKRWSGTQTPLPVFIEVNLEGEMTKTGLAPKDVELTAEVLSSLRELSLQGLMAVPSPEGGQSGKAFRDLRDLEERCRPHTHGKLSMGMTQDFEVAVREGATHVRIGTAIFGPRKERA